jgi:epoxyqueuosine reductase QueG
VCDAEELTALSLAEGFCRARVLFPAPGGGGASLLVAALPIGPVPEGEAPAGYAEVAAFAGKNYYREAVIRLKRIASALRGGGKKADWRIFCNSRAPEKKFAVDSGLGVLGRQGLIITPEAGTRHIIAALALPFRAASLAPPFPAGFSPCARCPRENPPCAAACPTRAVLPGGGIDKKRCIQWYASGNEADVPGFVRRLWGRRFYGCEECQRFCPWNAQVPPAVEGARGGVERFIDTKAFLALDDEGVRAKLRGTALGLSWLGPAVLRRNARNSTA